MVILVVVNDEGEKEKHDQSIKDLGGDVASLETQVDDLVCDSIPKRQDLINHLLRYVAGGREEYCPCIIHGWNKKTKDFFVKFFCLVDSAIQQY